MNRNKKIQKHVSKQRFSTLYMHNICLIYATACHEAISIDTVQNHLNNAHLDEALEQHCHVRFRTWGDFSNFRNSCTKKQNVRTVAFQDILHLLPYST